MVLSEHAPAWARLFGGVIVIPKSVPDYAGMGIVVAPDEPYSFKSDTGAILLLVESQQLTAHARAISTPQRIEGATWPSDSLVADG